ncbi:MAG: hypothetical protein GY898_21715 [Proteobacteria bacterium]|nr:hypothetical protein [Pseudomonadota bacterium]
MSAALFVLGALALSLAVFVLPGVIAARLALPEGGYDNDESAALLATAWGFGIVPSIAFWLHLVGGPSYSLGLVGAAAGAHVLVAIGVEVKRRRAKLAAGPTWWTAPLRGALPVVGAGLLLGAFLFVRFDASALAPENSCIVSAALTATGFKGDEVNLLTDNVEDARLGNTGVIAGLLTVWQQPAYRALHAICGLLLVLAGFVLGRRTGGTRAAGWIGAVVLAANPWVLGLPQPDENLIALAWASAGLALFLARRPPWFAAAMLLGLAATMRHVYVLGLPAIVLYAVTDRDGKKAMGALVAGVGLSTLLENVHHALALGSVFRFESNAQFPAFDYAFGLRWEGMMNWPLYSEIVRTPHVPLPTFAMWPLWVADHLGLLLFSTLALGFAVGWARDRREWLFWFGLLAPCTGMLALQESWDFPNKMGVLVMLATPMAVWAADAVGTLRKAPKVSTAVILVLAAGGWFGARAASDVAIPADARYFEVFPETAPDTASLLSFDQAEATDVGLLPDLHRLARSAPFLSMRNLRAMGAELSSPAVVPDQHPWGWFPGEPPPRGEPVTLAISLTDDVARTLPTVRVTDEPPHFEVTADADGQPTLHRAAGLEVGWAERDLTVYAVAGREVTTIALALERPGEAAGGEPCACERGDGGYLAPCDGRCSLLFDSTGIFVDPDAPGPHAPPPVPIDGPELRVRLPSGGVSLELWQIPYANRFRLWKVVTDPAGPQIDGPWLPWHS